MANFKTNVLIKNIIGKDLINNDNIAILELVKNSFDALSEEVIVEFKDITGDEDIWWDLSKITIFDKWNGMSKDDIINKWLNIAYSEKKAENFKDGRIMAWAKWVGRFSCDRLWKKLNLYTKQSNSNTVHHLLINWDDFEKEDINLKIEDIDVSLVPMKLNLFLKAKNLDRFEKGTLIEISELRSDWTNFRPIKKEWDTWKLDTLRKDLEKLINPNNTFSKTPFNIKLFVEPYKQIKEFSYLNGPIENTVFRELDFKSTSITSEISLDGSSIHTIIKDKGRTILSFEEKNNLAINVQWVKITLYYMSSYSKTYFAKNTWVRTIDFWSIFVFINGFRISPYWDTWDDWLGLEVRKAQWYKRYLGSRETIWRVEIQDSKWIFKIVSSREGIVENDKFDALRKYCIRTHRRLEKYVVDGIKWDQIWAKTSEERKQKIKEFEEKSKDLSIEELYKLEEFTLTETEVVKNLRSVLFQVLNVEWSSEITDFTFDERIIESVMEEDEEEKKEFINSLKKYSKTESQKRILDKLLSSEKKLKKLETENKEKMQEIAVLKWDVKTKEKQVLFLQSVNSDSKNLVNLLHQIWLNSETISKKLARLRKMIDEGDKHDIMDIISSIDFENNKIATVAWFATKINFSESCEEVEMDVIEFLDQYVNKISRLIFQSSIQISFQSNNVELITKFIPIEMTILVDNFVSNAIKFNPIGNAGKINFIASKEWIKITNNWDKFSSKITNINDIFEIWYTTSRWSWLGLYHIKKIIEKQWWTISGQNNKEKWVLFTITF